jgi:hypothetical protein
MTASARYLYCVIPAYGTAPAVCAPALDGERVHAIHHRDLAVLTHACAPEPYQGSETEVCGWIAAHNTVIEEAWKTAGTVLPMSFDVIVRGDSDHSAEANVIRWLEEHHAALRSRLQVLHGRVEVGVQIFRDAEDSAADEAGEAGSLQVRPRGRAYFAQHQRRREQGRRLEREAEAVFRRHGEMLAALADDVQINRLRPVQGKMMLLNLSLLTDKPGMSRVGDYLEQVSQEAGAEVRFTGPWPPYSFAGTFASLKEAAKSEIQLTKSEH